MPAEEGNSAESEEEPLSPNRARLHNLVDQFKELERLRAATLTQVEKTEIMLKTCSRRQFALTLIQVRGLVGAKRRLRLNESLRVLTAAKGDSRVDQEERAGIDAFALYVAKMNETSEAGDSELSELSENLELTAGRLRASLSRRKLNLEYMQTTLEPRVVRALERHNIVMIKAYERKARKLRVESFMAVTCTDVRDEKWLRRWLDCCGYNGEAGTIGIVIDPGSLDDSESEIMVAPVAFAAFSENLHALRLLHDQGADVNAKTLCGRTPMYLASAGGRLSSMQMLLSLGADVSLSDALDGTPLHRAIRSKKLDAAKWLVAHGAEGDLRKPSKLGYHTPLHTACMAGSYKGDAARQMTKWLLSTPACNDVFVGRERSLLESFHNTDVINRFFSRASSGRPCALALAAGNYDVAELLLLHHGAWTSLSTGKTDALMVHSDLQNWNEAEVRQRSASFGTHLMIKHYTTIEQFASFLRCIVAATCKHALWRISQLDEATSTGFKMKIAEYTGLAFGRRLRVLHGIIAAIDEFSNGECEESSDWESDDEIDDEESGEETDEESIEEIFIQRNEDEDAAEAEVE